MKILGTKFGRYQKGQFEFSVIDSENSRSYVPVKFELEWSLKLQYREISNRLSGSTGLALIAVSINGPWRKGRVIAAFNMHHPELNKYIRQLSSTVRIFHELNMLTQTWCFFHFQVYKFMSSPIKRQEDRGFVYEPILSILPF